MTKYYFMNFFLSRSKYFLLIYALQKLLTKELIMSSRSYPLLKQCHHLKSVLKLTVWQL